MNPRREYLDSLGERVRRTYDALAPEYERWLDRYSHFYERKCRILRHVVPQPGRVLEIGCGLGQNLAMLNPKYGLGIDISPEMIERARRRYPRDKYPNLDFRTLPAQQAGELDDSFDTILLVNTAAEIPELVEVFKALRALCKPTTRIIEVSFSYYWLPVIELAVRMGLIPRRPLTNWLTRADLNNIAEIAGFETIREGYDTHLPFHVPVIGEWMNRYLPHIPLLKHAAMLYFSVMRPLAPRGATTDFSVSVCVPCRNEEGNIAGLVARIPDMGKGTEIIFVDDQSTDGTAARVRDAIEQNPDKRVKLVKGPGMGKGAACRAGFAEATNDILMILDADMTVMPEDLPLFMEALVEGRGEFINGSRLVYPLESGSMQFANIVGNKLFAMAFTFLLSQRIKDTLCGTKVVWREDYGKILESRGHFGDVDRWGDYDWIFGAARHSLKIVELPVHYRVRVEGETKMTKRLHNALIMLKMCWIALNKVKLIQSVRKVGPESFRAHNGAAPPC